MRAAETLDDLAQIQVQAYVSSTTYGDARSKESAQRLEAELAQAHSRLETAQGAALLPAKKGQKANAAIAPYAEGYVWSALQTYLWLGQVTAMPGLQRKPRPSR